ncbi:MAG: fasciclin domain-containing protein, partial [Bacteroidota bacterium]
PLDVVGHAQANSAFTSLVSALGSANEPGETSLVEILQGDGPFTVFAPVNQAFTNIQSTVDGLTTEQLRKVLLYHVVSGANVRENQVSPGPITTANDGATITASSLDPLQLTGADGGVVNIDLTDVQGTNGVIHVLDAVLIPGNL